MSATNDHAERVSPSPSSLPAHYTVTTTPRLTTPRDLDESRFTVNSTALEILNGYTKAQEDRKTAAGQLQARTKAGDYEDAGRQMLYRYELNGIVVYDSHARCAEDSLVRGPLTVASVPLSIRKELEGAPEYDQAMFSNLPNFPASKHIPADSILTSPLNTLRFNSHFESGNLQKAIKVTDEDYTLLQDYDVLTKGHTQWFYFSVRNERKGQTVRFSIVNLMKYDSLYNNGMKPLVRSLRKEQTQGISWHRAGEAVSYYENNIPRKLGLNTRLPRFYYTLSFVYTFEYEGDEVFFAHCYPYTYTDLQRYIASVRIRSADILRVDSLCQSIAGNDCPILTLTNDVASYLAWEEERLLMLKTAAGRKMARQREERKEAQMRAVAAARGEKPKGRNQIGRKRTSWEERSHIDSSGAPWGDQFVLHDAGSHCLPPRRVPRSEDSQETFRLQNRANAQSRWSDIWELPLFAAWCGPKPPLAKP